MYNLTAAAPLDLTLDNSMAEDAPIISTPCDETLPEWMAVSGAYAVFLFGATVTALSAAGWFAAGMPNLEPMLHRMLHL